MIFADENINKQIIKAIRNVGIEVYSVSESNSGIEDEKVIELSRTPSRIILTEDKDFGEWVYAHGIKDVSVILLRYKFNDTKEMTQIITNLLQKRIKDLIGKFTVVTLQKIRIRDI